jgi:hypothetical protein
MLDMRVRLPLRVYCTAREQESRPGERQRQQKDWTPRRDSDLRVPTLSHTKIELGLASS